MKKHANKLLLIGLIFAATGIVANIICIIVTLFSDVLPWMNLDYRMSYTLTVQIIFFVFALLLLGLIVLLSVNVLAKNRLDKPFNRSAVFLIVVTSMAIGDIICFAWSYLDHIALVGITDALILDLTKAFIFRGRIIQMIGFVLLLIGAIGALHNKKICSETLLTTEEE